ncbi:microtubule-associated protein tau-like [Mizuhopecten yessoensis]|uniref:microtubule-associated protein tau-like n=1 Tax=Mizuhopecten yessoensis TaxID=6573 RepID=UPI000B45891F|nr:microtubule-associated protein tau-like [Mizuhopecten yessoensis]
MKNARHVPGGGNQRIINERVSWNTESKIGSLENTRHIPGGGHAQILDEKVTWKKESKVGSMENARHVPGGGNQRNNIEEIFLEIPANN